MALLPKRGASQKPLGRVGRERRCAPCEGKIPFLVLVTVSVWCGLSHAEGAEAPRWTLDKFRTSCIPIWSEEAAAACEVAEFGEVAKLGGSTLYFALYDDPTQHSFGWSQPGGARGLPLA